MFEGGVGSIDEEEFVDATIRLFQALNIQDRDLLFNFDKSSFEDPFPKDCTFRPQINRDSNFKGSFVRTSLKDDHSSSFYDSQMVKYMDNVENTGSSLR